MDLSDRKKKILRAIIVFSALTFFNVRISVILSEMWIPNS